MSGFGLTTHWIAARDRSTQEVADALRLVDRVEMEWDEGSDLAYEEGVYVTPPVAGWTLAHGRANLVPDHPGWTDYVAWVAGLSSVLGEVQCFGNERGWSSFQWIRAENGVVSRAYGVNDGDIPLFAGEPTGIELRLGVGTRGFDETWQLWTDAEWEAWRETVPNEMQVFDVAADWSIDPYRTDQHGVPGIGVYGRPDQPWPGPAPGLAPPAPPLRRPQH